MCLTAVATALAAGNARAQGGKLYIDPDMKQPFRTSLTHCIEDYQDLGGVAAQVLHGVLYSRLAIVLTLPSRKDDYSVGSAALTRFPNGQIVIIVFWKPNLRGQYDDGSPMVPCAVLLHEFRHAWDMDRGTISFKRTDTGAARAKGEWSAEIAACRTENWYLWRHRLRQRHTYDHYVLPRSVLWPQH